MRIPLVSSLAAMVALGSPLICAGEADPPGSLPVAALEIRPDGAWATRQGRVDGSGQILGLPEDFVLRRSRWAVDGDGPAFTPRLGRQRYPLTGEDDPADGEGNSEGAFFHLFRDPADPLLDQALKQRLDELDRQSQHLRHERHHLEEQLAVIEGLGQGFDLAVEDKGLSQAQPSAEELSAVMTFVEGEQQRILSRLSVLLQEEEDLRHEFTRIDQAVGSAPSAVLALHARAAAHQKMTLVHPVSGLRWAPVYRIRAQGDQAVLIRDALIDADLKEALSIGRLTLHGTRSMDRLELPRISRPFLSVADVRPPDGDSSTARSRELTSMGGSRASESAVDSNSSELVRLMRSDGSWGDDPHRPLSTGLALLTFLGAGYDHRTPNRYRRVIRLGMEYLQAHASNTDCLATQAVITRALAEAFLMTQDAALRPVLEQATRHLMAMADSSSKLNAVLRRRGPLDGPASLAKIAMAVTSLDAVGMSEAAVLSTALRQTLPQLRQIPDRHYRDLIYLTVLTYLGSDLRNDPVLRDLNVAQWISASPSWVEAGQVERLLFATLVLFQAGGEYWQTWNAFYRDWIVERLNLGIERQSVSSVIPHALGDTGALTLASMSLQIYYRYAPVHGSPQPATSPKTASRPARPSLPNVEQALAGWPLVLDLGPITLEAGSGLRRIHVDEQVLPGTITRISVPAVNPGVWRVLYTQNPLPGVLAAGTAEVTVDGALIGSTSLPVVAPNEPIRLDLGRDERFHVQRSISSEEREVGGRRVHTVTITFTLHGPEGESVQLSEALPRPTSPEIRLRSLEPAWDDDQLDQALHQDPNWHLPVTIRNGVASASIRYELRHPAHLRLHQTGGKK